jgi:hypothetical protein
MKPSALMTLQSKEILAMKYFPTLLLAILAVFGVAVAATAQNSAVKANVPFDFTVGKHFLPAGHYILSSPYPNIVKIQSADGRLATYVSATRGFQEPRNGSQLEFARYGRQFFLRKILCDSSTGMNLNFPTLKSERRMRFREAALDLGESVFVSAQ